MALHSEYTDLFGNGCPEPDDKKTPWRDERIIVVVAKVPSSLNNEVLDTLSSALKDCSAATVSMSLDTRDTSSDDWVPRAIERVRYWTTERPRNAG